MGLYYKFKLPTFLVLIVLVIRCFSLPENLTIGALFSEDDNDLGTVLECVIHYFNEDNGLTIRPRIIKSSYDSFGTGSKVCEFVKRKSVGIFGPQSPSTLGIVKWISEDLGIPNIRITSDWSKTPPGASYINLHPDPYTLAKAYASVVKDYLEWKSFTILYETEEGLQRLQDVLQVYSSSDRSIVLKQLSEDGDNRVILKEMLSYSESRIIIDCAADHVLDILRQAEEVKVLDEYHGFFITSLDTHTLDLSKYQTLAVNVTSLRLVDVNHTADPFSTQCSGITSDNMQIGKALMHDAANMFLKALIEENENEEIHMKRISCDKHKAWAQGPNIVSTMKQMKYNGLTGPILFDENGRRTDFNLKIIEVRSEGLTTTATWNVKEGLIRTQTFDDTLQEVEKLVRTKIFRVVSRTGEPYLSKKNDSNCVKNDCFEGFSMDLIDAIAKLENFGGYEFFIAPDNGYGSYNKEKKSWDGLMKQVLDKNADLGICDLAITAERREVADFSTPFMDLGIKILYKKPPKAQTSLFSFLTPFDTDVWLYMLTAFLGVSILMYVVARITPYEWGNPHPCDQEPEELENSFNMLNCMWFSIGSLMGAGCDILPRISPYEWKNPQPYKPNPEELENDLTLSNCFWHNIGSLMQMGSDIAPQAMSTRVLAGMWWFFAMIMIASYTANLAAFLTSDMLQDTIRNVEELAGQSKIKYGTVKGGATSKFFQKSTSTLYQKMWMAMEEASPSVFTENNDQGVIRVQKGNYAFFMESSIIEYQKEKHCDLMEVGDRLDNKGYGIVMPLNSPYRSLINRALLSLLEKGIVHELKKKWLAKAGGNCDKTAGVSDTPELGLENVGGVFLVVVAGGIPAFILSLCELMWKSRKIAVEEKITPCEAISSELKFALNMSNETKPTNLRQSSCANSEESA